MHDDGPGIPAAEVEVLTNGTESDLEHGSGLGLWTVVWCLRRLGGDVTFERTDDGTTVRLWLPETTPVDDRGAERVGRS
ncbi:ATP-binding protein [Halarchaeum nitratireducens]|uniref:ATP-binding protein n=1 Tax=Halarchaeum nitratireducens TaxID=489913 RepID=UPI0038993395